MQPKTPITPIKLCFINACSACLLASFTGCAGYGTATFEDPAAVVYDPSRTVRSRVLATDQLAAEVRAGTADREATKRTFSDLAWATALPLELRAAGLRGLVDDSELDADARELVRLMLPREQVDDMTALLSETAASRGWTETTPSLVRSLSRPNVKPDEERSEYLAIRRLHPDQSVAAVAFGVFMQPEPEGTPPAMQWSDRTRADAWDLLARLDPSGALRAELLVGIEPREAPVGSRRSLEALRRGLRELRVVPITGDELRWLLRLADTADQSNAAWWAESSSIIASIPASNTGRLEVRHIEAVRWASNNAPELLALDRNQLFQRAQTTLQGRDQIRRTADVDILGRARTEKLESWDESLGWGDLLTLLVTDRAIQSGSVLRELARQAELDRRDRTTEYGGMIEHAGDTFEALLYAPRPSQRVNDRTFIASRDLIEASDRALVHYHLHAQSTSGRAFAGPSAGDQTYAARSGRTCVVITTVSEGMLNVDLYQPDGAVIDLGTFAAGSE
ncbi:MAG: hypothetical protein AAF747_07045 [Planctomycetota bacterium]